MQECAAATSLFTGRNENFFIRSSGKVNKKTLDICTRDREKFKLMFNEISHCLFPDTSKT